MGSVIRTLELLETLGRARRPMSLAELARETNRPKSSLHRQLATLMCAGYVKLDADTSRYDLSIKLWSIGVSVFARLDVLKIARPHLEVLMVEVNETVHLAALDSPDTVVYVAKVECSQPVGVKSEVGDRFPAYSSSTGRAILAFQDSAAADAALNRRGGTDKGAGELAKWRAKLAEVRAQGYAVVRGETFPERGGVSAPIRRHTGEVIASCSVAIPTFRMTPELTDRCIPAVLRAARNISRDLGYEES